MDVSYQKHKRRRIISNDNNIENNNINDDETINQNDNFNNYKLNNLNEMITECLEKINIIGNILLQNQEQINIISKHQGEIKNNMDENIQNLMNKNETLEQKLDELQNNLLSSINPNRNVSLNQCEQIQDNIEHNYFS